MPRQPGTDASPRYIGVSTKMYLGYRESLQWLRRLRAEMDSRPALSASRVVPFVVPSFPVLPAAADILAGSPAVLGAQNCGWSDGPWTGEVSPSMLAELQVGLVEIGHAERRKHFGEDGAMIARKVKAADDAGIVPLLCVGEERLGPAPQAAADLFGQIQAAVQGDWGLAARVVIAYEPVWAIGAAEPAGAKHVSTVAELLRKGLSGAGLERVSIIYGGSAKPGLLPRLDKVDGLFLGRFAHRAANFGTVLDEALALEAADALSVPRHIIS